MGQPGSPTGTMRRELVIVRMLTVEDAARVRALHAFAEDLASRPHVRVVSFQDLFEAG